MSTRTLARVARSGRRSKEASWSSDTRVWECQPIVWSPLPIETVEIRTLATAWDTPGPRGPPWGDDAAMTGAKALFKDVTSPR